jgi:hypothetical protein
MSSPLANPLSAPTLAFLQARNNLEQNRLAIRDTQPDLVIGEFHEEVEWVFGRDRALTCRDGAGQWLCGCSLPRRAAAEMMQKLDIVGAVACFLSPTHGAQLRVALDKLRPEQAIIAIVSDTDQLAFLLACDSFELEIQAHRLWLVTGPRWMDAMRDLFRAEPGLSTPMQFIRLPIADETIDALIAPAQKVFGDATSDRSMTIRTLRDSYQRQNSRICLLAPSQFRLWNDAGAALMSAMAECDTIHVDVDQPRQTSSLKLAQSVHECGVIVSANIGRSDLQGVLSESVPFITWCSGERVPAYHHAAPLDRIVTGYPKQAIANGWPPSKITEAAWPLDCNTKPGPSGPGHPNLAIIANTRPLDPPADLIEFSSHRVLWELIANDLLSDPFSLTDDIDSFLSRRMRKLDIVAEAFPAQRFVNELILPAYQQGLARILIRAKAPLSLFGAGWDRIPEFAGFAAGQVTSRENLREIASEHIGLVHMWPSTGPHPIDTLGRPVLRRRGSHGTSFLNDAKQILTGRWTPPVETLPPMSAKMILSLIS